MTPKEIGRTLKLTAQLMELHNENPFKIKSLNNAAFKLDKLAINLEGLSEEKLSTIEGIGKGIAQKIHSLQTTGELEELKNLIKITPLGVIEMLSIKGIGPKKVAALWKELGIESIGELLYACNENRLLDLKGFGEKTQEQIKKAIEFTLANAQKIHFATALSIANEIVDELKTKLNTENVSLTGSIRRKCQVIEKIEIIVDSKEKIDFEPKINCSTPIELIISKDENYFKKLFETTASPNHLSKLQNISNWHYPTIINSEEDIYRHNNLQFIEPELREGLNEIELARNHYLPKLIELTDLQGILHNHTTYSDGIHSLREMAIYCKELGYHYLGICDHSQSAFYAKGLKPDRVIQQQLEIDILNKELAPFKIFKGIESDILNNGSLDYSDEILETFDFVVASIHSNLKMDQEKATQRLLKAIENPFTTILGHMTGRLLLSREGYPIDHKKIIDACAANNVIIELNAHPYRLDIDWRWIPYCLEKEVKISINPDAHQKEGYHDLYYGLCVARKGMLTSQMCFNAMKREDVEKYFQHKKKNQSSGAL